MHAAGQHVKKNYELPYIALVSESEHKVKSSGRSRTKSDGICEARRIVPGNYTFSLKIFLDNLKFFVLIFSNFDLGGRFRITIYASEHYF